MTSSRSTVPQQRRQYERTPCRPPQEVEVEVQNVRFEAIVEDISPFGARLRLTQPCKITPLELMGIFDFSFKSSRANAKRLARTAWVQKIKGDICCGVEFVNIPQNTRDLEEMLGMPVELKQLT